jgi:GalNAc-alpha-(1->4)-GalNAc-alpha-(1->3)-diNAcBac-PP-undecaprenol alpha-1,4-N-acetyl-D-galactosaminyltransferase
MEEHHDLTMIIGDLADGGTQRVVSILANYWVQKGRRIAIITMAETGSDYFELDPRVDRFVSGGIGASGSLLTGSLASLTRISSLRKKLRETRSPTAMAFVSTINILAILAAVGLGIRMVISERNDPVRQSLGPVWNMLRRLVYPFAGLVTANSQSALMSMSRYVASRKLRLVRNPVSLPSPIPPPAPEPMILNVGRLVPQKGQDILLDAFSQISADAPDWKLVIIGEGPEGNALRSRAATLGITDRVTFIGRTDPWPHYARAAIFALPSLYEGTSNALLEAMSMGIPTVVSRTSGSSSTLIEDGTNGVMTATNDATALATALKSLVDDPDLRQQLGQAAAAKVLTFSTELVAAEWETLLEMMPVGDPKTP